MYVLLVSSKCNYNLVNGGVNGKIFDLYDRAWSPFKTTAYIFKSLTIRFMQEPS